MKNFKSLMGLLFAIGLNPVQATKATQPKTRIKIIYDSIKKKLQSVKYRKKNIKKKTQSVKDSKKIKIITLIHEDKPIEIIDLEPDPSVIKTYKIINGVLHIETKPNVKYWSKIGGGIGNLGLSIYQAFKMIKQL